MSTLRNVGGSVMMTIPKSLLEGLGLSADTKVRLSVERGRLVVEPQANKKYALSDLLAQCDATASIGAEEQAWQDGTAMGDEAL